MSKLKISLLTFAIVVLVFVTFTVLVSSGRGAGIDVRYVGVAGGCTEQNPILVTITNRLPVSINNYLFKISAKRDGYSTDVRYDLQARGSDKIISAFGSDRLCWGAPPPNNVDAYLAISKYGSLPAAQSAIADEQNKENPSLQWSGDIKSVSWDFGYSYRKF